MFCKVTSSVLALIMLLLCFTLTACGENGTLDSPLALSGAASSSDANLIADVDIEGANGDISVTADSNSAIHPESYNPATADDPFCGTQASSNPPAVQEGSEDRLSASGSPSISVSSAIGKVGETVILDVTMANNPGIIALGLSISYDSKYVRLANAADGGIMGSSTTTFGDSFASNPYILTWEDSLASSNHTANGLLATLEFEIVADPGSSGTQVSAVITDAFNYDLTDVGFLSISGVIASSAAVTGSTTIATSTSTSASTNSTASSASTSTTMTTTSNKVTTSSKTTANSSKPTTTTTTAKLPDIETKISRLSGTDRVGTAIAISKKAWTKSTSVVLASGMSYPDALAGAPLAFALDAPILLTANKGALEPSVLSEISRLGAKRVYILGGVSAVSDAIMSALSANGIIVERVSGSNRYETAVSIAKKLIAVSGKPNEVFLVSGANFPDALAISSVAAITGSPILYLPTTGALENAATVDLLESASCKKATILGGTSAVSEAGKNSVEKLGFTVSRVCGSDRYATALAICKKYENIFTSPNVAVVTGANFPDALAGGAYAAKLGMPVVLVGSRPSSELNTFIKGKRYSEAFVLGGQNTISDSIAYSLFS